MADWTELDRFEASINATKGRLQLRLKHIHEKLDDEDRVNLLPDTIFGKLIGERDELVNASIELDELISEFKFLKDNLNFQESDNGRKVSDC